MTGELAVSRHATHPVATASNRKYLLRCRYPGIRSSKSSAAGDPPTRFEPAVLAWHMPRARTAYANARDSGFAERAQGAPTHPVKRSTSGLRWVARRRRGVSAPGAGVARGKPRVDGPPG